MHRQFSLPGTQNMECIVVRKIYHSVHTSVKLHISGITCRSMYLAKKKFKSDADSKEK